jgi:hypothetical protein
LRGFCNLGAPPSITRKLSSSLLMPPPRTKPLHRIFPNATICPSFDFQARD